MVRTAWTYPWHVPQFVFPQPFFSAEQSRQLLVCAILPVALQNWHGLGTIPTPRQRLQSVEKDSCGESEGVEECDFGFTRGSGMMSTAFNEFRRVFSFRISSSSLVSGLHQPKFRTAERGCHEPEAGGFTKGSRRGKTPAGASTGETASTLFILATMMSVYAVID